MEIEETAEREAAFLASIGAESETTDDQNELDIGDSDVEFFYLDSDKAEVFEIYKLVRLYQTAADNLDPTLIKMICKERNRGRGKKKKLDLEDVLTDLALIHYGVWRENDRHQKRTESQPDED
jgi:ribosome biogenesis protein Nip4